MLILSCLPALFLHDNRQNPRICDGSALIHVCRDRGLHCGAFGDRESRFVSQQKRVSGVQPRRTQESSTIREAKYSSDHEKFERIAFPCSL